MKRLQFEKKDVYAAEKSIACAGFLASLDALFDRVAIVDRPVDYSENMKLTEKFKELKSPV